MRLNRVWALAGGLAVLTCCATVALAATALRYELKPDAEWRYKTATSAEGTLTVAGPLGAQPIPVTIEADETRSLKVLEAGDEGWFKAESRQLEGTYEGTVSGQALDAAPQPLPAINYSLKLNALGDVKDLEQLKAESGAQAAANTLDLKLGQLSALAQLTGFPEQEVNPGDTWDKELQLEGEDGQRLVAKVHNTLVSLEGDVATISSSYDMPIPPTEGVLHVGMDLPIRVEGQMKGVNTLVWDTAAKVLKRSDGEGATDIKLFITGLSTEPALGKFTVRTASELVTP